MRDFQSMRRRKRFRLPAPGTLQKRFCARGHDKYEVGVIVHMWHGKEHHAQCALCIAIRKPSASRREYVKHKEYYLEKAKRWKAENHDRVLELSRRRYRETAGVNFWVEAAKESI